MAYYDCTGTVTESRTVTATHGRGGHRHGDGVAGPSESAVTEAPPARRPAPAATAHHRGNHFFKFIFQVIVTTRRPGHSRLRLRTFQSKRYVVIHTISLMHLTFNYLTIFSVCSIFLKNTAADSAGWEIWSSDLNKIPPFNPNMTSNATAFKRKMLIEGKLRHAASNGNLTLFKTAISMGGGGQYINVWSGDRNGRTWLHHAAMNGYGGDKRPSSPNFLRSAFGYLLPVGTSAAVVQTYLNVQDGSGQTALHEAALNGWNVTFKTLLDLGASITARAKPLQGEWALGWTMMNYLASLGPAQSPDTQGRAARVAVLDSVLQYGQTVLTQLEKRPSPLYVDVQTADPSECVCSTVSGGCCKKYSVQPRDPATARYRCRGMTVLDYAVLRNHAGIVQMILSVDRTARYWRSNWCETPLHKAAQLGHDGIVKIFLDMDAAGPLDRPPPFPLPHPPIPPPPPLLLSPSFRSCETANQRNSRLSAAVAAATGRRPHRAVSRGLPAASSAPSNARAVPIHTQ